MLKTPFTLTFFQVALNARGGLLVRAFLMVIGAFLPVMKARWSSDEFLGFFAIYGMAVTIAIWYLVTEWLRARRGLWVTFENEGCSTNQGLLARVYPNSDSGFRYRHITAVYPGLCGVWIFPHMCGHTFVFPKDVVPDDVIARIRDHLAKEKAEARRKKKDMQPPP